MESEIVDVISLGAGVQSSAMALMAARGEITPMPKAAIFADTQSEPESVYKWLDWLEFQLPFPVIRVTRGNLADASLRVRRSKKSGRLYMNALIPAFVTNPDGKRGIIGRYCTRDYKIHELTKACRGLCDWKRGEKRHLITSWIGISIDEAHRMKPARVDFIKHRWPLIDLKMSRNDCLIWAEKNKIPKPPRSACVFCPFHSDDEWLRLKKEEPEEFSRAVEYERQLHATSKRQETLIGTPYLHESRVSLSDIDFESLNKNQGSIVERFGNECEGMCGV